jgi:predicted NBD/HSP70 family sugar kinase
VDVTPRITTVVVADLEGNILESEKFPTSSDIEYMNSQILSKIGKVVKNYPNAKLEVGLSIPGIADQRTGSILYIPYFQWSNWDIGNRISAKFGLPVAVDNDANAVALAELWFGEEDVRKARNIILVFVGEGIGTGIIIDGQVYRGEKGAAGEFGHMYVSENAPVACSCGRTDCWEAHASEKAIVKRYNSNGNSESAGIGIEQLIGLAENGERRATSVLKESAKLLGIGISNLIIGFSPEVVIVSGSMVRAWELIKDEIQVLADRSIRHELSATEIVPSTLGDEPTILGAISLVLARKFASAN